MSLTLKSIEVTSPGCLTATYEIQHWTPGASGTCLSQHISLDILPIGTTASIIIDRESNCQAATPEDALKRMSAWLRRLADGIDEHKTSINLPL